jgi:acetylornithine aminotransferase
VFTGEAKPNVIRLLPSLALTQQQADEFIEALQQEVEQAPALKGEERMPQP